MAKIESGDPEAVAGALYAAARFEQDVDWIQAECLKALTSRNVSIRWAGATCRGDLAFMRRPLNAALVITALEIASNDTEIADPARFSLSMVKQFLANE